MSIDGKSVDRKSVDGSELVVRQLTVRHLTVSEVAAPLGSPRLGFGFGLGSGWLRFGIGLGSARLADWLVSACVFFPGSLGLGPLGQTRRAMAGDGRT